MASHKRLPTTGRARAAPGARTACFFKLGRHGNLFDPFFRRSGDACDDARCVAGRNRAYLAAFLPDGRHFLFHSQSTQPEYDGVLYVRGSLDSTTTTPLGRTDSHAVYALGHLLYLRATLVAHPFDAGGLRFVGEPVGIADKVDYNNITRRGAFSASETGTLVYRPLGVTQLAWFDRNGEISDRSVRWLGYGNPLCLQTRRGWRWIVSIRRPARRTSG